MQVEKELKIKIKMGCVVYSNRETWEQRKSVDAVNRCFAFTLHAVKSRNDKTRNPLPARVPMAEKGSLLSGPGPRQRVLERGKGVVPEP